MLNRFRIGIKLFAGFTIVLLLLILVWVMERWASVQQMEALEKVEMCNVLSEAALSMQRDVYFMLVAERDFTISRTEENAEKVRTLAKQIVTTHNKDIDLMLQPNKDRYKTILDGISKFAGVDHQLSSVEQERMASQTARTKFALSALANVESLIEGLELVTREQDSKLINIEGQDVQFYPTNRIVLERRVRDIKFAIIDNCQNTYIYECAKDAKEREETLSTITANYQALKREVEALREVLVHNTETLDKLSNDLSAWFDHVLGTIALEKQLVTIDDENSVSTDKLIQAIKLTIEAFHDEAKKADMAAQSFDDKIQRTLLIVCLFAIAFGVAVSIVLTRNITVGITAAVKLLQAVAHEGDISQNVPEHFMTRRDEVGDLANVVHGILNHFCGVKTLADNLAQYDYSVEAHVCSEKDVMNILLNKMIHEISEAVREINEDAARVATGASEVASISQHLSNGAQQSAASLEEITASMQEISSQTKTNADSAVQARNLAQASSKVATEGQAVMHELTGAMARITENSHEIQRVIKVVDDIAFQTNLLALNAAVEAARAGQHGKGFAVVAEEVRNLASRSAKAARETAELIVKSSQEIDRGGEIASHTSGVFDTIVEQIKQTTDLVAGIAVACNEQSQGIGQISIGLHQIDGATQTNSASAEESASAASEMSLMAQNLQALVAKFKLRDRA